MKPPSTVDPEPVIAARRRADLDRLAAKRRRYKSHELPPNMKVARLAVPTSHPQGARTLIAGFASIRAADRTWFLEQVTRIVRDYHARQDDRPQLEARKR